MTAPNENSRADATSGATDRGVFQIVLEDLASARLATAVGCLIVSACIVGTLLPQGADVQKFLHANPHSAGRMKVLATLGLTNVFDAWWFIVLLVFFSLNVTACLIRRVSARLRSGYLGMPGWGFLLTHVSILLILGGAVIRGAVGQRGAIEIQEGQSSAYFMGSVGPVKMPFEVQLVDFALDYYEDEAAERPLTGEPDTLAFVLARHHINTQIVVALDSPMIIHPVGEEPTEANTFRVVVSRYVPDFVIDMASREVSSRSEEPRNPAILVGVEGPDVRISKWLFANHPDFGMHHSSSNKEAEAEVVLRYRSAGGARLAGSRNPTRKIRSFKSTLQLVEDGKVVRKKTIEVNSPLSYRGYTLYQSGYNPQDLTWSTIEVVRDPGVPVVYGGFACMIGGLILLLCFKPAPRKVPPVGESTESGGPTS